jgi:citrate synthase
MTRNIDTNAYWVTSISKPTERKVFVRGYDLEELIGQVPFSAAIFLLIRGRLPKPQENRVLDAVLSAVLDYGLEKPGTVAARYAVSANPSMAAGLATACLSVGSHTLATEDTARFIISSYEAFSDSGQSMTEFADDLVAGLRARKERLPGIGHPVFKKIDPRAAILRRISVEEGCWPAAAVLYEEIHAAFIRNTGKEDIPINDVGVMAAALVGLGFTPEEGTGLAILSTMPGVIAHISEEFAAQRPIRVVPRHDVDYQVAEDRDLGADQHEAGWDASWQPLNTQTTVGSI